MVRHALLFAGLASLLPACSGEDEPLCGADPCPAPAVCVEATGRCELPSGADGGADASVPRDASAPTDGGVLLDGSLGDASDDAGVLMDAGSEDAATTDAQAGDTGMVEADAGHLDAGAPDSGIDPNALDWVFSLPAGLELTRTEVTVAQFGACLATGACNLLTVGRGGGTCNYGNAARAQHPINCVTWDGATAFCAWAGGRLPTEQEWYEEAAGGELRLYAWGDEPPTCARTVMFAGGAGCGMNGTSPVCSKPQGHSVSGLCDMTGNVWEWTSTEEPGRYIFKGGSWDDSLHADLANTGRAGQSAGFQLATVGFRCVREVP